LLALARAIHFGATLSLGGVLAFGVLIADPVLRRSSCEPAAVEIHSRLRALAWVSLTVMLASGVVWLGLEAQAMSGLPMPAIIKEGVLWTTLAHTQFGRVALVRLAIALAVAACLGALWHRSPFWLNIWLDVAALTFGAALATGLAWTGHAAASDRGGAGVVHLLADSAHLLAAMAWLGALVPLALFLAAALQRADSVPATVVKDVIHRFSTLGIVSVATLLVSGMVNTWFLAGTLPALLGTPYGQWLLLKIALFLAMVGVAAFNRFRLTPRLSHVPRGGKAGDSRNAAHQLVWNALIEAALGVAVLGVVGLLGTLPPGLHTEPTWPLPFRLPTEDPQLDSTIANGAGAVILGLGIVIASFALRRQMKPIVSTAVAIAIMMVFYGVVHLGALAVPAYPTSYLVSPTGYTVTSIADGRTSFATHCAACHGGTGHGDGPLAKTLPIEPADLTAEHIYAHLDGELFWWITNGIDEVMPGFGRILDTRQRWNLIDFIHANADALRFIPSSMQSATRYVRAPDFTAQCADGSTLSLRQLDGRIVRLVFLGTGDGRSPAIGPTDADASTVIVSTKPPTGIGPYCVVVAPEAAETYRAYLGLRSMPHGAEFLIDGNGALRAAWYPALFPDNRNDWREPSAFQAEVEKIRRNPVPKATPVGHAHVH
jgi:putative copper resistance protein D